jgi:hypothetical protein
MTGKLLGGGCFWNENLTVFRFREAGLGYCTAETRGSKRFLINWKILRSPRTLRLCGKYVFTENPEQPNFKGKVVVVTDPSAAGADALPTAAPFQALRSCLAHSAKPK